jgi:hypothetical protein
MLFADTIAFSLCLQFETSLLEPQIIVPLQFAAIFHLDLDQQMVFRHRLWPGGLVIVPEAAIAMQSSPSVCRAAH